MYLSPAENFNLNFTFTQQNILKNYDIAQYKKFLKKNC